MPYNIFGDPVGIQASLRLANWNCVYSNINMYTGYDRSSMKNWYSVANFHIDGMSYYYIAFLKYNVNFESLESFKAY